jgi:hypothetical protein
MMPTTKVAARIADREIPDRRGWMYPSVARTASARAVRADFAGGCPLGPRRSESKS